MAYILDNMAYGASVGAFAGLAIAFAVASVRAYKDKAYKSMLLLSTIALAFAVASLLPMYALTYIHANAVALFACTLAGFASHWCATHAYK